MDENENRQQAEEKYGPPPPDYHQQQQPPQPNTSYPPQQPGASYPLPQPPYPYQPPPHVPPKKRTSPALWVAIGVIIVVFLCLFSISLNTGSQNASTTTTTSTTTQDTPQPTDTVQPTDTPVPIPTVSSSQLESAYKALTKPTTVEALDKNGNSWKNKDVRFTCTILSFVKDDSGNTAGANVDDPNTSGVVQVIFPTTTDLSRLNTGDTLKVWGTDDGTFSGQNAFGGTVQEVGITAQYMTDTTTNYQTS